ncbi:hypothetical protein K1T71_005596 [Dendrolimus kikuchii]|uniref:Uncharacterized protein n=1 Tax=Dendrolimus kikuchii TaxID=765133 RepID=A0ACC1D4T0_9NEOP|nr:hypothetical protein K1T71_005596 [Dendrolimus kikuchii]
MLSKDNKIKDHPSFTFETLSLLLDKILQILGVRTNIKDCLDCGKLKRLRREPAGFAPTGLICICQALD